MSKKFGEKCIEQIDLRIRSANEVNALLGCLKHCIYKINRVVCLKSRMGNNTAENSYRIGGISCLDTAPKFPFHGQQRHKILVLQLLHFRRRATIAQ